jgi:hypothetical protein
MNPPFIPVIILFFITGLLLISYAFLDLKAMMKLVREDEAIENIQAILYLMGACLWFLAIFRTFKFDRSEKRRQIFYILFFLMFLFFFLEEISWGQRIFGTSIPEGLKGVNLQDETNIHNIGIGGSLLWIQILMALFLLVVGVVFPILKLCSNGFITLVEKLKFPVSNQNLIACFAMSLVTYSAPGFHWYVPLFILAVLSPVVIILSGAFKEYFIHFQYPLLQFTLVAVMGLVIIGLNANLDTANNLTYNIAFEIRELLVAMAMFFFAFFETREAWLRTKTPHKKQST